MTYFVLSGTQNLSSKSQVDCGVLLMFCFLSKSHCYNKLLLLKDSGCGPGSYQLLSRDLKCIKFRKCVQRWMHSSLSDKQNCSSLGTLPQTLVLCFALDSAVTYLIPEFHTVSFLIADTPQSETVLNVVRISVLIIFYSPASGRETGLHKWLMVYLENC